jgi:hypothetical protein
MSNALDELERQLRHAVRNQDESPERAHSRHLRAWVLAGVAMLLISAGALAATNLTSGKSITTQGDELARLVERQTQRVPACNVLINEPHALALGEGQPIPAITDLLPSLNTPVSAQERTSTLEAFRRSHVEGILFARTVRTISLSRHIKLLVGVGSREDTVRDPAACGRLRRSRATTLATGRPTGVLRRAEWRLSHNFVSAPGVQSLDIDELPVPLPPHTLAGGGVRDDVWKDNPLKPGIVMSGGYRPSLILIGIARRGTTRIRIRSKRLRPPPSVPVVEGFFVAEIPPHTGPFALYELSKNGTVTGEVNLRQ